MQSIIDFILGIIKLIVFVAIVVAGIAFWGYNKIRRLAEDVKEALSNISVSTEKRNDLINRLQDVARSYQESEKLVMLQVSRDNTVSALRQTYLQSGAVLTEISGMAQRFPELKSNQQYNRLMDAIQGCEGEIERARTRYNGVVKEYNTQRTSIPHVFYSGLLGFRQAEFLHLESATAAPMISDDGERINQLLGMAGTKVMGAAQAMGQQGKILAERGAAKVQQLRAGDEFTYLDSERNPKGPVSRTDLAVLFDAGQINGDTHVLKTGTSTWLKYTELT